jgi:hypothetical protein
VRFAKPYVSSVAKGAAMATAAKTTKQIIQAYEAMQRVKTLTRAKLDALLETNPLYKLFEPDTRHPYYLLSSSGKSPLAAYEALVAGLLSWTVGARTIGEELHKVKAHQIENAEAVDQDLDALLLIEPVAMTEAEAVEKLLYLYNATSAAWSSSGVGFINAELAELHGRKNISRHKESPELEIAKELGAAVREIRKLAKALRDCGNGSSTIRRELEKQQAMRGLAGQSKDRMIEGLLKNGR